MQQKRQTKVVCVVVIPLRHLLSEFSCVSALSLSLSCLSLFLCWCVCVVSLPFFLCCDVYVFVSVCVCICVCVCVSVFVCVSKRSQPPILARLAIRQPLCSPASMMWKMSEGCRSHRSHMIGRGAHVASRESWAEHLIISRAGTVSQTGTRIVSWHA